MARQALLQTFADIKAELTTAGDPRSLIREHPWIAMATGTGIGCIAASLLLPRRDQSLLDKYAPLVEKLRHRREDVAREEEREERPGVLRRTVEKQEVLFSPPTGFQVSKTILKALGRLAGLIFAIARRRAVAAATNGSSL